MSRLVGLHRNLSAFLDMIAWSEIGPELLRVSDDGYNVLVGSTPRKPLLFGSYDKHPKVYRTEVNSDAAGRYQFMGRYWEHYKDQLGLPDFGPESQDKWAIQLIRECGAVHAIESGLLASAIASCRSRWASLPGAGYGQHEQQMAQLILAYQNAGGEDRQAA